MSGFIPTIVTATKVREDAELLPVEYFHVVFTTPSSTREESNFQYRDSARGNQRKVMSLHAATHPGHPDTGAGDLPSF